MRVPRGNSGLVLPVVFLVVLMMGNNIPDALAEDTLDYGDPQRVYANLQHLTGLCYRLIESDAHSDAQNWIKGELESYGLQVEEQVFTVENACEEACVNVLGWYNQSTSNQWLVVGAH